MYITRLSGLRHDISHLTLSFEEIDLILIRNIFYYKRMKDIKKEEIYVEDLNLPKESCLSKFYRIAFTSKPDPYYCDFYVDNFSESTKSDVLSKIKLQFCFTKRNTSTCFKASYSSKSSVTRNTVENKIILPVTSSSTVSLFSPSKKTSIIKCKIYPCNSYIEPCIYK